MKINLLVNHRLVQVEVQDSYKLHLHDLTQDQLSIDSSYRLSNLSC